MAEPAPVLGAAPLLEREHKLRALDGLLGTAADETTDTSAFFDPETWARLREVKALYDPSDMFKVNHHVPPA